MRVVIVGAGPAGLVTCKTLIEASTHDFHFDPVILEQEDDIGGEQGYARRCLSGLRLTQMH